MVFTVKAYAKINLALNVYEKKADGYHNVDMVSIPLVLHDILELEPLPKGYDTFITSDDEDIPTDESNLSYKAYLAIKNKVELKHRFLINIHKRIPMSAGLGGGSADAAAVLNAINKIAKLKLSNQELISLANNIGGDVAFCLFNKPARCQGIGGDLTFFKLKKKYFVLLIKPSKGIQTKQAYQDFDDLAVLPPKSNIERLIKALEEDNEQIIQQEMKNDLQTVSINIVPEIKDILDQLKKDGFPLSMMSGSGSTVFCISKDQALLHKESMVFAKKGYKTIITQTL